MNRSEFFRKLVRYILFAILAGVAVVLGSKAVAGNSCASCPGNGICKGETDCSTFLSE